MATRILNICKKTCGHWLSREGPTSNRPTKPRGALFFTYLCGLNHYKKSLALCNVTVLWSEATFHSRCRCVLILAARPCQHALIQKHLFQALLRSYPLSRNPPISATTSRFRLRLRSKACTIRTISAFCDPFYALPLVATLKLIAQNRK